MKRTFAVVPFTPAVRRPGCDENGVPLGLTPRERRDFIVRQNAGKTIRWCERCQRAECGTPQQLQSGDMCLSGKPQT